MTVVLTYDHWLDYHDTERGPVPAIVFSVSKPGSPDLGIDIIAHLDTGAELSLFDGEIANGIGLNLFAGEQKSFAFTQGGIIRGYLHTVSLSHPLLGEREFEISFSRDRIYRNLLGRD